jgi:transposase
VATIGIDIGGHTHVVARCREGQAQADRKILRLSQSRAGFASLEAWLAAEPEPIELVVMESSGHYWMPLAAHLRRSGVPVAVVNPLAARYFAKSRLERTKSDPADAWSLAEMAMRDSPEARDPLAGVELRQSARFAMTLVAEQAKVCQRLYRLVELGFPELRELFEDPTCRTARAVLRLAPTAQAATRRRTSTLANANGSAGHRRLGQAKAERLPAAAEDSIEVPELDAEVSFEVGLLLDQFDLLERQVEAAEARVAELLDGELARRLRMESPRATASGAQRLTSVDPPLLSISTRRFAEAVSSRPGGSALPRYEVVASAIASWLENPGGHSGGDADCRRKRTIGRTRSPGLARRRS